MRSETESMVTADTIRCVSFSYWRFCRLLTAIAAFLLAFVCGATSARADGESKRQITDVRVSGVAAPHTEGEGEDGGQPIAVIPAGKESDGTIHAGEISVSGWQGARSYGDTFSIVVEGESGASVRFITSNCSVEPASGTVGDTFTVRVGGAGVYAMTAIAHTSGGEVSDAHTGSAGKADQQPLTINGWGTERNYYQSFNIQVFGGTTNGTISFLADGCSVSPATGTRETLFTVTVVRTGAYTLTAVMSGDAHYAEAYSAQQCGMADKNAQNAIVIGGWQDSARYGDTFTVNISGGSTNEAMTVEATGCTATRTQGYEYEVAVNTVGPYSLTASRAGNYGYTPATVSVCGVSKQAEQPVLTISGWTADKNYGDGFPVRVKGGIEGGLVHFNAVGCTVAPLTGTVNTSFIVTVNTVGAYSLTAYVDGTVNYLSASTRRQTGTSGKGQQPQLRMEGWVENAAASGTFDVTLGGGGGTGSVCVSTYGGCTAMLKPGTTNVYTVRLNAEKGEAYSIAVEKAGDANYNDAKRMTYEGTCGSARQTELMVVGWQQDAEVGSTFGITLTGGSGNGIVSFDVEGCTVDPPSGAINEKYTVTVTAEEGEAYALTVNRAADDGYAHASTLRSGNVQLAAQSMPRAQDLRRQQQDAHETENADTLLVICGVLLIAIVALLTVVVGTKALRKR